MGLNFTGYNFLTVQLYFLTLNTDFNRFFIHKLLNVTKQTSH